jgi:hypothetical protein
VYTIIYIMKRYVIQPLLLSFLLFSVLLFFGANSALAKEKESLPAITVINPIRGSELGHEKDDLLSGLKAQWKMTRDAKINATWLWQYTALEDSRMVDFVKTSMPNQEFGLFLEIDRNFARKSAVQYRGQGPWYFSDGLFLMSYDKDERKKLIDEVFHKFKKTFGYYPKTVGAWWIGADSLVYMQKKYGITAAMRAADQFDLDVYSIWGTPWSIPYLSSKENEAIPASSFDKSSKVVILQWAARDPTQGYQDPLYSVQDFSLKGYDYSYINYVSSVFLKNPLDHVTFGLENNGASTTWHAYYQGIMKKARELEDSHNAKTFLVKDYAEIFLAQRKTFAGSDTKYFLAKAYKSDDQSFWYNSGQFRAGIEKEGENIYLVDLRSYANKVNEPFAMLPNSQGYLRIAAPSIIDSIRFPEQKLLIASNKDPLLIAENGDEVTLFSGNKKIAHFIPSVLEVFQDKGVKTFTFEKQRTDDQIFLFDKKELFLFYFLPISPSLSIPQTLVYI